MVIKARFCVLENSPLGDKGALVYLLTIALNRMAIQKGKNIPRDLSWLSFNARVLQEAADPTVPLRERIRFLGIFSNNLDEFFRVRVATLKRMMHLGSKSKMHLESDTDAILD